MRVVILGFLLCFGLSGGAQNFYRTSVIKAKVNGNQISNPWVGGINAPLLSAIELNGDNYKDLFVFDALNNRIETFVNNGIQGTVSYTFAPEYISAFPKLEDWVFLYDYNCDGLEDIFTHSDLTGSVRVFRNVSVPGNVQFSLLSDQLLTLIGGSLLTNIPCTKETYPTFADVDGDGDTDILAWPSNPDASVDYHINQSQQLGYGCDSLIFNRDGPCWGHFTFCLGTNEVCVFNALCKPQIDLSTYWNPSDAAKKDDTLVAMLAIDLDADNDFDLLVGDVGSAGSLAVYNGGTPQAALMASQDTAFPSYSTPVNKSSFLQHASFDLNNDGRPDLLASSKRENYNRNIALYIDTNALPAPAFSLQNNLFLQDEMFDFGRFAFPAVFDYDNDGKKDLVVGNEQYYPLHNNNLKTGLALLRNTGSALQPEFNLIDRNYGNINSLSFPVGGAAPAFGDLDGDSDADMIIGSEDGKLYYFTNTSPIGTAANFMLTQSAYFNIDVGNYSIPQIVDLNLDGLNDLVVGRRNGRITYFQNSGTTANAVFSSVATKDTLGGIILTVPPGVTGYTSPFFYNDNGTYKLYVSCEKGDLYQYGNINGNILGTYALVQTIISGTEGNLINIGVGDLNNDGFEDIVVGNQAGGLSLYFQNVNPNAFESIESAVQHLGVVPNPAQASIKITPPAKAGNNSMNLFFYDVNGRLLKMIPSYKPGSTIAVDDLAGGIYLVTTTLNNQLYRSKIVIIKNR